MALLRCSKCGHLREVSNTYIGKSVKCPQCKEVAPIHNTVMFVEKVLEKYFSLNKELHQLQEQLTPSDVANTSIKKQQSLENIDIYNTSALANSDQYKPIQQWFQQRQIEIEVNQKAIDTTGFFDEVALALGNQYGILKVVSDQIKYVQRKGYINVKLNLAKKNQKQIQAITKFCRDLYDYSFVAKYFYQNREKIIRLNLQTSPAVVNFFNGEWMEWFVFMKLLEYFSEKQLPVACLRNLVVTFPNEDSHELDVFFLIDNRIPVCIECKSGEFRQDIDKYVKLRKRLKIDETEFLLCVVGLSQKQALGLSSMYELTFVNEDNFLEHVERLL